MTEYFQVKFVLKFAFLFSITLMQNIIELFQLPQANEKCSENYLTCKGLSLVCKAKGYHRNTNGEKWWENQIVAWQSIYGKFESSILYQSLSCGVLALAKYYPPFC